MVDQKLVKIFYLNCAAGTVQPWKPAGCCRTSLLWLNLVPSAWMFLGRWWRGPRCTVVRFALVRGSLHPWNGGCCIGSAACCGWQRRLHDASCCGCLHSTRLLGRARRSGCLQTWWRCGGRRRWLHPLGRTHSVGRVQAWRRGSSRRRWPCHGLHHMRSSVGYAYARGTFERQDVVASAPVRMHWHVQV